MPLSIERIGLGSGRRTLLFAVLASLSLSCAQDGTAGTNPFQLLQGKNISEIAQAEATRRVGELVGTGSPLALDQHQSFAAAAVNPVDFHPVMLIPSDASDLDRPLPPGDYALKVRAFCTQFSIHEPGQGLPYKLASVAGKQAGPISALLARGEMTGVAPMSLNAAAWRIEAGLPISKWPAADRELAEDLIPEFVGALDGDAIEQTQHKYDALRAACPSLPPFDNAVAATGAPGKAMLVLRGARTVLSNRTLAAERLPDMLYEPTDGLPRKLPPDPNDRPSEWNDVAPHVVARFSVIEGNLGLNLFEFRVLPTATATNAARSRSADVQLVSLDLAAPVAQTAASSPTLGTIFAGKPAGRLGATAPTASLIGYSIGRASQALILFPAQGAPDLDAGFDLARYVDAHYGKVPFCVKDAYADKYAKASTSRGGFWFDGDSPQGHQYLLLNPLGPDERTSAVAMNLLKANIETVFPGHAKDEDPTSNTLQLHHKYMLVLQVPYVGGEMPKQAQAEVEATESSRYHFKFEATPDHYLQGTATHGVFKDRCGTLWMFQQGRGIEGESWAKSEMAKDAARYLMWDKMADNFQHLLGR